MSTRHLPLPVVFPISVLYVPHQGKTRGITEELIRMDKLRSNSRGHRQFGNFFQLQLPTGSVGLLFLLPCLCSRQRDGSRDGQYLPAAPGQVPPGVRNIIYKS